MFRTFCHFEILQLVNLFGIPCIPALIAARESAMTGYASPALLGILLWIAMPPVRWWFVDVRSTMFTYPYLSPA